MQSLHTAFLRPEFTTKITDQLLAGASINLISPHGQGRRRTLHDLRQNLPASTHVFHLNMQLYKDDYKGFFDSLCSQAEHDPTSLECLQMLLHTIEKKYHKSLLILHNFDALRAENDIDQRYDQQFFQALNSIQQRCSMALLCVSTAAYEHYRLHADGSKAKYARIKASPISLPTLSKQQLIAELQRRDLAATEDALHALSTTLLRQPAPYSTLKQLAPYTNAE